MVAGLSPASLSLSLRCRSSEDKLLLGVTNSVGGPDSEGWRLGGPRGRCVCEGEGEGLDPTRGDAASPLSRPGHSLESLGWEAVPIHRHETGQLGAWESGGGLRFPDKPD